MDGTYTFTVTSQATHKETVGETETDVPDTTKVVTITIEKGEAKTATVDGTETTIDGYGYVQIDELPVGYYTVTEDETGLAAKNINLVENGSQTVLVTKDNKDGIKAAEFTNNRTYVQVSKVDATSSEELKGATIQVLRELVDGETTDGLKIIDKDGKKYVVVDEWVSTDKAHVVENLTVDQTYILHEEVAPDGYLVTSDTTFSIDQTGKVTATGSTTTDENGNEVLLIKDNKTHIEVSKVDIADGEELEGATIQILRKLDENEVKSGEKTYVTINEIEYEVVEEWVSEKKAHVVEGLLTGTEYTLHEEVAPDGYLVTSDTTFSIDQTGKVTATGSTTTDENGNEVLLIEDNKTHIEVSKVDIADGEELSGATIQILRKLDENEAKSDEKTYVTINEVEYEVVEEWVSEKNKTHVVEGLLTGTEYILHETVAPEGYDITVDTTFSIDENGNVTGSATINNSGVLLVECTPD